MIEKRKIKKKEKFSSLRIITLKNKKENLLKEKSFATHNYDDLPAERIEKEQTKLIVK